ncbi:MAG: PilZ domain-containing protein [Lachnospiraceae bacterium]|nr:PilZ domain-containing protein [Lachnospiraceae bacterium]
MEEISKRKRIELSGRLVMKRLNPGGEPETQSVFIDVQDLSAQGIGFNCDQSLTLGHIYEAYLTIWTKEVLHVFIQLVRGEQLEEGFNYGAIFIGMPEGDSMRIEVYETVSDMTAE